MSDAVVGGLVTGGFALVVLVLTLRHATKQAGQAEAERSRIRRSERLRDSYRDYVAAAYAMQGHAALLPIALIESERGRPSFFNELTGKQQADMSKQNASLMLEDDTDQAIIGEFSALNSEHMAFLAEVAFGIDKDKQMPHDEYVQRITSMGARADKIAKLARDRLAELAKPQLSKRPWWKWPWWSRS